MKGKYLIKICIVYVYYDRLYHNIGGVAVNIIVFNCNKLKWRN